MKKLRKPTWKRVFTILLIVIVAFSITSLVATKFIYDAIFVRYDGPTPEVPQALEGMVASRESRNFYSGENELTGWLYRCEGEQANGNLVLITPGFHAGADNFLWQIHSFLEYGWSVFIFDATGHCTSEGESAVGFPQLLCDVESALEYIENSDRFGYNHIALFGHSQGGYAVTCALAGDFDISAVVSVSGINSAMDGIIGKAREFAGPVVYGNYPFLWLYQVMVFGGDVANRNATDAINASGVPVLIVHGSGDTSVPVDQYSIISCREQIESGAVQYYICDDPQQDGHTDLLYDADGTANDALMEQIHTFLIQSIE